MKTETIPMSTPQTNKQGKTRGLSNRKVTITFAAFPPEIDCWQASADADDRPLSQWIRLRLLEADRRDEALKTAPTFSSREAAE
jgi:hypothetical protein